MHQSTPRGTKLTDGQPSQNSTPPTRRQLLTAAAITAGAALAQTSHAADRQKADKKDTNVAEDKPAAKPLRGRIRQSVMGWCFNPMPVEELAGHCRDIGLVAIEGIDKKHYRMVQKMGLKISLVSSHGFKRGMCNPADHDHCLKLLHERIDLASEIGSESVITFTGMLPKGMSHEQATMNCVAGWKKVMSHAEKKKINLCLEHLNTRDSSHPMKGHPGYFGDDVDHCVRMIQQVGSPRMKLLFDVYHVQIMNGDVIRRIRQYKDYIGHYHTAGNPGRGELDDTQEINYPAVMKAILETGYKGYVAQEFIPTWKDKAAALRHAAHVCDV